MYNAAAHSDDGDDYDKIVLSILFLFFFFSFVDSHIPIFQFFFNATRHLFIARVGI